MCDWLRGVATAAVLLGLIGLGILVEENRKTYRITEDEDELGYWLEDDDESKRIR